MSDNRAGTGTGGNGLWIAGGIIVCLIGAGVFLSTRNGAMLNEAELSEVLSSTAPAVVSGNNLPQQEVTTISAPDADTAEALTEDSSDDVATMADAPEDIKPDPVAPSIDEVRLDAAGTLVIAGRASPGDRVDVMVDGEVVTSTVADGSGAFAALGALSESTAARSLTLRSGEGEAEIASVEEIILAPVTPLPAVPSNVAEETQVAQASTPEAEETVQDETTEIAGLPEDASPSADEAAEPVSTGEANASVASSEVAESGTSQPETLADAEPSSTQTPATPELQPAQTSEIAVLRSDDTGVSLLAPAAPPATEVVLDTIGYTDEGDVQLSGRAGLGTVEIRAYLNNSVVAQLPVDTDGNWRGEVPQIAAGVYTLRVDALNADGTVSSRVETPFKREEPAVLAAATEGADGRTVRAVTVQAGDTLWAIARDRYGEGLLYVQVFEANRTAIRDPDLIYPGQVFDLPAD